MSKPINISNIINARLDAAGFVGIRLTRRLKDYFSDIDEEIAKLRKKVKLQEHENYCWYCGENRMYPVVDYAPWYECYGCGATKCLNPTRLRGLPEIRWDGISRRRKTAYLEKLIAMQKYVVWIEACG